jgi:formylglycine-generating enzyme required for sulfatase activity
MRVLKYLAVVFLLLLVVLLFLKILSGTDVDGSVYNPDGIELVYVEGTDRLPSFYIGKYEVTQAQYEAIMGVNPSKFKGPNHPVENVSWNDAQEFITKLNARTGRNYRLPTAAEWVYAAREGNNNRWYEIPGSDYVDAVAWYGDNSGGTHHPVGQKLPNALGISDMIGNVWERLLECDDRHCDKHLIAGNCYTSVLWECTFINFTGEYEYRHKKEEIGLRVAISELTTSIPRPAIQLPK